MDVRLLESLEQEQRDMMAEFHTQNLTLRERMQIIVKHNALGDFIHRHKGSSR